MSFIHQFMKHGKKNISNGMKEEIVMRILKGFLKVVFWCLILVLLITPVGLIFEISNREMEAYEPPEAPILQETAYGSVSQAYRTDVYEYVTISGNFVSNTYAYMELDQKEPSAIRWDVNVGEEIQEGQTIGTYKGQPVVSTLSGILVEKNSYSSDAYLKVKLLESLELECCVTNRILNILKRDGVELKTEDGEGVTLLWASQLKNSDETTNVRLSIDSDAYYYGQAVSDLKLMTGSAYLKALVLDEDCVYQKESGEDAQWYARKVTAEGKFMAEVEVSVGYRGDGVVCVSGVNEGDYFDAGYKAIVGEN